MYSPEDCAEISTLLCEGRGNLPWLFTCGLLPQLVLDCVRKSTRSPDKGYWDHPIRTSLVSFNPAWPWGALLQDGFKVLPFSLQSLWKQLVKLEDFKEQLLRISEEINRYASKSSSHVLLSPDWHHMSWRSAVTLVWLDLGPQVPRFRFYKSWWPEPDGGKNQALLFKLRLLWSWLGSIVWDSLELLEVQDQNGEYMRHSDLQNLNDGRNPKPFFLPKGA